MSNTSSGIATLIVAGVMNASFTMPMKFARKWAWENVWLVWAVFALIVLPLVISLVTIPNLLMVYRSATLDTTLEVCGFGMGWGVAQVFFGLAVDMIGIALAFSIVLGTSAAIGSLLPMISLHRGHLSSAAGYAVFGADALVLLGVALCAVAGMKRDAQNNRTSTQSRISQGLLLSILCGLLSSFMNLGVAFGTPLALAARASGANSTNAINVIWLPLMLAGAVPNVVYSAWLINRNSTGQRYRQGPFHWLLAAVMAVLWFGSTLLYGQAANQLGVWGPILGWPLFMALIVITATLLGMLMGEWKRCGPLPVGLQWAGVTVLVVAVFILADSSRHLQ